MRNKAVWIVLGVVVVAIIAIVAVQQTRQPKEEKVIKIGAILPLTGDLSLFGGWLKEGIALAAQDTNVEVIYEDNKNDTSAAVSAFRKLVSVNRVNGVIAARTPVAFALSPLSEQNRIPMIFTFADLPDNVGKCVGNYHFPVSDEIKLLAQYAHKLGEHASILVINDEFGRLSSDLFKRYFRGKIVFEEFFEANRTDFRSILSKIPDNTKFIFLIAYEQNFVNLIKQMNERNVRIPILGPNVLTVFLGLVEGQCSMPLYVTMSTYDAQLINHENTLYGEFVQKFKSKYNKEPNMVHAEAYEATKYLVSVLKEEDPCTIMQTQRMLNSLFGHARVDANGQVHFPLAVVRISGGKRTVVEKWSPDSGGEYTDVQGH